MADAHRLRARLRLGPEAALALLAGAALWELAGRALRFPFLPPLTEVLSASRLLIVSGEVLGHLATSLGSLALGFGAAVALGLPLGALMGRYRKIEHLFDVYLQALLASPGLIYVPILFALFGTGRGTQAAVVFLYAFFVIVANTLAGVRSGDQALVEMARSLGADERQLLRKVILPGAVPLIMAGLRLGMARGLKGMINGEMYVALIGLGALIRTYGGRFEAAKVFGILLIVVAVAVGCVGLVQALERRLTRWAA